MSKPREEFNEPSLFDHAADWNKEWQGMPEFVQEPQREYAKLTIRFRNEEDLQEFARLIGQRLNRKSKSTWHPRLAIKTTVQRYVDES